jgi:hypothetical protein
MIAILTMARQGYFFPFIHNAAKKRILEDNQPLLMHQDAIACPLPRCRP